MPNHFNRLKLRYAHGCVSSYEVSKIEVPRDVRNSKSENMTNSGENGLTVVLYCWCHSKVFGGVFMLSCCFLDYSVGVGVFVTGLSQISSFLALLVETSRAYAIPRCPSVRPSVRKQFLLSHLLCGYLSQILLYSPSLLALWCSCAHAIVIMILSPGAPKGGVAIFTI